MNDQGQEAGVSSLYWVNGVCIHHGFCWASELIEVESKGDELKRWDVRPICLGSESDILPVLKGKKPIPDDMCPRKRALLEQILEVEDEFATGARSIPGGRPARSARAPKRSPRRAKTQQRLSLRQSQRPKATVPQG